MELFHANLLIEQNEINEIMKYFRSLVKKLSGFLSANERFYYQSDITEDNLTIFSKPGKVGLCFYEATIVTKYNLHFLISATVKISDENRNDVRHDEEMIDDWLQILQDSAKNNSTVLIFDSFYSTGPSIQMIKNAGIPVLNCVRTKCISEKSKGFTSSEEIYSKISSNLNYSTFQISSNDIVKIYFNWENFLKFEIDTQDYKTVKVDELTNIYKKYFSEDNGFNQRMNFNNSNLLSYQIPNTDHITQELAIFTSYSFKCILQNLYIYYRNFEEAKKYKTEEEFILCLSEYLLDKAITNFYSN